MRITYFSFHWRVQFRRKNGRYSIALPGVQFATERAFYLVAPHGFHAMRVD